MSSDDGGGEPSKIGMGCRGRARRIGVEQRTSLGSKRANEMGESEELTPRERDLGSQLSLGLTEKAGETGVLGSSPSTALSRAPRRFHLGPLLIWAAGRLSPSSWTPGDRVLLYRCFVRIGVWSRVSANLTLGTGVLGGTRLCLARSMPLRPDISASDGYSKVREGVDWVSWLA